MRDESAEWIAMAETDYGVAKHLFETYYPKPLEIICYHCQQSAEKAIKALIIEFGAQGGLPKVHDLSFLLNQIKNKVKVSERLYDYADTLTPYGVSIRYPNELHLEERHAKAALDYSLKIIDWAKACLQNRENPVYSTIVENTGFCLH